MNLLLVGASSLIGREIYCQAKKKSMNVIGTATHPVNPEWYKFDLMYDNIETVLSASGLLDRQKRGEAVYVIVTAFYCGHERTLDHLKEAEQVNLIGMRKMFDVFHALGIRALFFSTEQVFDGKKGDLYKETDQVSPVLVYGRHKVEMEQYLLEYMPEMLIYRLSQNLDVRLAGIHIFNDIYNRYKQGERNFKAIKGQILCPTYIGDTARWAIKGIQIGLSGIYHCANSESMSRADLVRCLLCELRADADVEEVPMEYFGFREGRPFDTRLDISKLKGVIPELSFMSVHEMAKRFVENVAENDI